MKPAVFCTLVLLASSVVVAAQEAKPKPEDTEVWKPIPTVVTPGATSDAPPSDAIILFDGKNEDEWVSAQDHTPAKWVVAHGLLTVAKGTGNIETRRAFKDYRVARSRRYRRLRPGPRQQRRLSRLDRPWR